MGKQTELEAVLREVRERLERLEERLRPEPRCVKLNVAAVMLNVSTKHVGRMVRRGDVGTVDVGGARRIPMSEIQRVASMPSLPSSGATAAQVRFDGAAARARLRELRKKKGKPPEKR